MPKGEPTMPWDEEDSKKGERQEGKDYLGVQRHNTT